MILNQRIWLDENMAIRLKHTKHDVNLDHSSFPFAKNSVIEKNDKNVMMKIYLVRSAFSSLTLNLKCERSIYKIMEQFRAIKKREKIWIDITYDKNRKYLQYNQMNS